MRKVNNVLVSTTQEHRFSVRLMAPDIYLLSSAHGDRIVDFKNGYIKRRDIGTTSMDLGRVRS